MDEQSRLVIPKAKDELLTLVVATWPFPDPGQGWVAAADSALSLASAGSVNSRGIEIIDEFSVDASYGQARLRLTPKARG